MFQGARGTFSSKSWTAPTGMTEEGQINSQANVSAGLADLALTATGSTGAKTSTFGASANLTTIIVAIPQPPTVLFYQTDQLGSTRLLTDSAGVVRGAFSYDAYGNTVGTTGSYSTPLGYAGQYEDAESGLIYLRGRYFDPLVAQFVTRDPMTSTRSPYGYTHGNPLNGSDPSGRCVYGVNPGCQGQGQPNLSCNALPGSIGANCAAVASCQSIDTCGAAIQGYTALRDQAAKQLSEACELSPYLAGSEAALARLTAAEDQAAELNSYLNIVNVKGNQLNRAIDLQNSIIDQITWGPALYIVNAAASCVSGGVLGAGVGATGLPVPVLGEITIAAGSAIGCGVGTGLDVVSGHRFVG